MSTRTLQAIKKLVGPYMLNLEERIGEDGPHVTGLGIDGAYHDFLTVEEAMHWANEQYFWRATAAQVGASA